MGRAAHLLDEPEEEVVVLAAVAGRALTAHGSHSVFRKTARWQM